MRSCIQWILAFVFLSSCYYDNEEYLYGEDACVDGDATYAGVVSGIIQRNCLSCHSQSVASGGIILDNYNSVSLHAKSGRLLGAITHASGFSPMPKNAARLSDCNINAIKSWVESGALNN